MEDKKINKMLRIAIGVVFFLLVVCMFLLFPKAACPADKWTTLDYTLQSAVITTQVIDWGQTLDIAKSQPKVLSEGDGWRMIQRRRSEINPILGDHPSVGRVNTYFISSIILNSVVAHYLPKPYRNIFQVLSIGCESYFISRNYHVGLKINF